MWMDVGNSFSQSFAPSEWSRDLMTAKPLSYDFCVAVLVLLEVSLECFAYKATSYVTCVRCGSLSSACIAAAYPLQKTRAADRIEETLLHISHVDVYTDQHPYRFLRRYACVGGFVHGTVLRYKVLIQVNTSEQNLPCAGPAAANSYMLETLGPLIMFGVRV
jgi:hypothetical protein